jgi:tetratricopeptide (TPR) repeat protein
VALLRRRNAEDYCREALRRSKAKDYAGSLAAADRAIAIAPQTALAYHLRGCALSDLGQHGSALNTFRQAIALDPASPSAQGSRRGRASGDAGCRLSSPCWAGGTGSRRLVPMRAGACRQMRQASAPRGMGGR